MISLDIKKESILFNDFDRYSKFLLIGNSINGYVNVKVKEFNCYEEVIQNLPRIINDLAFYGNWDLTLYQVTRVYKLEEKPKKYFFPKNGKKIFQIDAKIATSFMDIFVNFSIIQLVFYEKTIVQKKDKEQIVYSIELKEKYITILLEEHPKNFNISLKNYHGNQDKLFDSQRY